MIDSHAHIAMYGDREQEDVLARAADAGVSAILSPATGPGDIETTLRLYERWSQRTVIAIGFHPHEASALDARWRRFLEASAAREGVVAVGEIGLDYHYEHSPREDQRRAFDWQLGLALERGLPVVLHQREAWSDFLQALDAHEGIRGVAHCFTEGGAAAAEMLDRGLLIGVSGMVTFPRGDNVRDAVSAVPLGRFLVETDSPYLAPVPHRGRPNEPAFVRLVAEAVAAVVSRTVAEVEAETDRAFAGLFQPSARTG